MSAEVKSETIDVNGRSVQLVSVKNGEAAIGTCFAGHTEHSGSASTETRLFYIGNDPIINLICPNHSNKQSDKLVSFCPGFQGYEPKIHDALGNSFAKLNEGESLAAGLHDIFTLLEDGVYTVYMADYYPTDGSGVFFWGGYNISHEVRGTAENNRVIGERTFKPCFLVPTESLDYFTARTKVNTDEQVKRRRVQGIVYHLTGLHSAVLKGHHGAVSCVDRDIPYSCAVIEKITEPYTDIIYDEAPAPAPVEGEEGEAEVRPAAPPKPVFVPEGITGFRSPSVKIPLGAFPREMLRLIIEGRPEYKPRQFSVLSAKLNTVRRKAVSNNVLPFSVLERSEQMPDCEMIESAYAIDVLTDDELNCLLRGDVECNGEVIVSPNFYSSIVTACNFLQFSDTQRFVDFSIAIMDNPDLAATHEYVAHRAAGQGSSRKLYNFFKSAVDGGDAKYEKILPVAQTFVNRYKDQAK
ncbi:MAG: hypothetical protein NC299_03940 [Lachnospiraceae bacterium]|nr:hypothetical protein [Ruminococcus sp.]MCM1274498.1 hypothetical protein [Lachnospiraceae bacterium]